MRPARPLPAPSTTERSSSAGKSGWARGTVRWPRKRWAWSLARVRTVRRASPVPAGGGCAGRSSASPARSTKQLLQPRQDRLLGDVAGHRHHDALAQARGVEAGAVGAAHPVERRGGALDRPAEGVRAIELLEERPSGQDVGLVGETLQLALRLTAQPGAAVLGEGAVEHQLRHPLAGPLPVGRERVAGDAMGLDAAEPVERHAARLGVGGDAAEVPLPRAFGEHPAGDQGLPRNGLHARAAPQPGAHRHHRRAGQSPRAQHQARGPAHRSTNSAR